MTIRITPLRRVAAIAVLALAAWGVQAQMPHGGPGAPGGHGLAGVLLVDSVHSALALSADQETLWVELRTEADVLQAKQEATRVALQTAIAVELAKPAPDLAVIEEARLDVMATGVDDARALHDKAAALYRSLSSAQHAALVTAIRTLQSNRPSRPAPPMG